MSYIWDLNVLGFASLLQLEADIYLQCINEHLLYVDSLFSFTPGDLKIVILVLNAFISLLMVLRSAWSLGKEAILVRKAGWYTEHIHLI